MKMIQARAFEHLFVRLDLKLKSIFFIDSWNADEHFYLFQLHEINVELRRGGEEERPSRQPALQPVELSNQIKKQLPFSVIQVHFVLCSYKIALITLYMISFWGIFIVES